MSIVSGGPEPPPPVARIPDLVHRAAAEFGEAPFVAAFSAGRWSGWSFRAASNAVRAFAAVLVAHGVGDQDTVVIQSENRPEWGLAYLAILEAGAIAVPLDAQLQDGDLGEILAASQARLVVASRAQRDKLERVRAARGLALEIVPLEEVPGPATAIECGAAAEVAKRAGVAGKGPDTVAPLDALAVLLFTSGTTGRAKAVMLTHANILANVEACVAAFNFGHGDRFLSVLPLHHAFECTAGFLAPLRSGASIAYARSLKSNELLEDLETSRATIMLGVPLLYEKFLAAIMRGIASAPPNQRRLAATVIALAHVWRSATGRDAARLLCAPLRRRAGLGHVRMFVTGAAPLRAEIFKGFTDLGLPLLEGYGLTECSPVVAANRPERSSPGSVGWPLPGVDVRIVEPGADGTGEVAIRGPSVMRGYFRDPAATALVLRDGWFHSGDLGRVMDDGRLALAGRIKNLIVTASGKKIYPEEIEARLAGSRFVREVAVIAGRGSHGVREEVHAHVVPALEALELVAREHGRLVDEAFVRETLENEVEVLGRDLAPFKRVKKLIVRRDDLPKTSTGKIRRDSLDAEQ
jgi:long-chain acyl-CoA synthetase